MIEIKNKHMVLFPEDRLIGAEGDVSSAQRKFVLNRIQNGFDLSDMVAWIKIDPAGSGQEAYDQMLKKEIIGDNIILTWNLSAANLKKAGELSVQIIFAATNYFDKNDLAGLSDSDLIVPAVIKGVSAPVWQSYCETFVVGESIDDTVAYEEATKNVLVAAAATAIGSAESALGAAENAQAAAESAQAAENEAWQAVAEASEKAKEVEDAACHTIELRDELQGLTDKAAAATENAKMAAINANAVREEVEAGGYIESLKEMNEGEKFSFWVGTRAEYEACPDKLVENRLHIITDEDDIDEIVAALQKEFDTKLDAVVKDVSSLKEIGRVFNPGKLSVEAQGWGSWTKNMKELQNYALVAFDVDNPHNGSFPSAVLTCARTSPALDGEPWYDHIFYYGQNDFCSFTASLDKNTGILAIETADADVTFTNVRGII